MERTTISVDEAVMEKGRRNAKLRGFGRSFSAYVGWLIERDARGEMPREEIGRIAEEAALNAETRYEATPPRKGPGRPRGASRRKPVGEEGTP